MAQNKKTERQREYTEQIAFKFYQNRLRLDKPGNEHSDWEAAEKIVRSPIRTTLFVSNRFLVRLRNPTKRAFQVIAWDTPKWILFSLPKLEWMKLLAVPLVIAAASSIITGQIQREAKQNAVLKEYLDKLETLTFEQDLLAETPSNGAIVLARGRTVAALRELDQSRKTQLIAFLQASGLSRIEEEGKEPVISFRRQNLSNLDLRGTSLREVDFQEALLRSANLEGADLKDANLEGAGLRNVNLEGAGLWNANLQGTNLNGANLEGAYLWEANLQGASLNGANLEGTNLWEANLNNANLEGAKALTQDQLTLAKLCRTTLPDGITLDSNYNCKELGIDPETGEYTGP